MLIVSQKRSAGITLLRMLEKKTNILGVPQMKSLSEITTANKMSWTQREAVFEKLSNEDLSAIQNFFPEHTVIPEEQLIHAINAKNYFQQAQLKPVQSYINYITSQETPCVITLRDPSETHSEWATKKKNISNDQAKKHYTQLKKNHEFWENAIKKYPDHFHKVTYDQIKLGPEKIIENICKLWKLDMKERIG